MLSDLELAQQLKNLLTKSAASKVASSTITTQIISGTAQSNSTDSSDGKTVSVLLDAAVVVGDDQDQAMTLPTNVSVDTGDTVQVTCTVHGSSVTSMIVTGVTGRGTEVATTASDAKATADAAADTAATTAQHFWADADGAHVSSTGDHDTSGFHQLMSSVKNAFMHGTTELMTISENLIELGKNSTSAVIKFCNGLVRIAAKTWIWSGTTRTGIDMHSTYGTSISADTSVSLDASVEATQLASDGSPGGAINLNGKWIDLYSTDMFSSYQIKMDDVATALNSDFSTVHRAAGVTSAYNSAGAHYTKIGTWSATHGASTLRLRVMTGGAYNGFPTQNSWIDIFIKKSNTTSGTTNAFGVSYELHNANSALLAPYVVATAYNSCDIWVKNSWGWENGWYVAEYGGLSGAGTWSDGGSVHQTSVPSGTLQSASCLGAAVYSGSKTLSGITTPDFNFLSNSEYTAITGHAPNNDFDTITVCSGDDSAYRGIMTASIQPSSGNIVIRCDPAPGGAIRVNYTITTG